MFATFTAIFEALDAIEKELGESNNPKQREKLIETLLSLRKTMDKCVQYWLKFEERVTEIQERFGLTLPDTLPRVSLKILRTTASKARLELPPRHPRPPRKSLPLRRREKRRRNRQ